jgi:hypothetical protein
MKQRLHLVLSGILLIYLISSKEAVAEPMKAPGAADSMTSKKLADIGEIIIFGKLVDRNPADLGVGKGECSLCHSFNAGDRGHTALDLNLFGITKRAVERIKEARYLKPDTIQLESFPGSGRATTSLEYIVESLVCPSCYVVVGFGLKGTNDRESLMPAINRPPISLTIDEQIAVITWLYMNDGEVPDPPKKIRTTLEKFIPVADRR